MGTSLGLLSSILLQRVLAAQPPSSLAPAAAAKVVPTGFTTAHQVLQQRGEIIKLTTGCKALDEIMGGEDEQAL